jgi:hypothetical protein
VVMLEMNSNILSPNWRRMSAISLTILGFAQSRVDLSPRFIAACNPRVI